VNGGLGSAVLEVLADHEQFTRVLRIGLEGGFSSIVGSQQYLRQLYKLDAASIAQRTIEFLKQ
jgi:transketolase